MKRSASVLLASLLVSLIFASGALAHEGHGQEASATVMATTGMAQETADDAGTLVPSGGPGLLLPAAALLLGAGVLSYAVLRRTTP